MSSGDVDDCFDGKETDKDFKKKKNRCALCRKKVGLTGEYKDPDDLISPQLPPEFAPVIHANDSLLSLPQVLSVDVGDFFALCTGTVTSTTASLITEKWAPKKFGATIQLLLVKKCKKFELFSV